MNKIESSTEKWIQKDRRVWITHKPPIPNPSGEVFFEAIVISIQPKQISVHLMQIQKQIHSYGSQLHKVAYEDCQKLTYGTNDVADMVDLQQLNQPELLFNLKRRYLNDSIFTYCGPTLVFINPYAYMDRLFNDACMLEYQNQVFQPNLQYKNLSPHIFGLTAFCVWQLFQNMRNQSIVISGESGAGKTQNTKYCLKFLASLGKNMRSKVSESKSNKSLSLRSVKILPKIISRLQGIQDKILGCNQILQAFGNAKTIRNDNSSRFGKLIILIYGESHVDIRSAFIVSYLLQKSRIVSLSEGERNYHIFYYILKGTTAFEKREYMLTEPINKYNYLNQSTVYDRLGVTDQHKFQEMQNEFSRYFTKEETRCIFRIISVVLNIGNLTFKKELTRNNEEMAVPVNKECLATVAKLLQVDLAALEHSFQFKTRKMGFSVINSPLRFEQAVALQNSFAKNIYERAFFFLVIKLNEKIELQKINIQQQNCPTFRKSIGLLDIFGFEVLTTNSLEQFFINFANEKLQQLYVCYIFKEEQNQFLKEGLKQFANDIDFQDNKPVIDLFELYPLGLFHLINESSELNKPDEDLPQVIQKNHIKNQFVSLPKSKRGVFLISHSCSPVSYNTAGFTSRNKDQFPQQLLEVIMGSKDQILKTIIFGNNTLVQSRISTRNAAKKFMGSKFLNDMNKLTEELYASDCHFVRCIKPNNLKAAKKFNSQAVLQSLRYLGVLDSILIRKLGFVYRRPFKQFVRKFFEIEQYVFGFAEFISGKNQQDLKRYSQKFIKKYLPEQYKNHQILLGHKKVLIKQTTLNRLQTMLKEKRKKRIQSANCIKQMYQSSVFRREVQRFLGTMRIFKTHILTLVHDIRLKLKKKSCQKIQKQIRRYLMDKRLQKIRVQAQRSVTKITSVLKMMKQRHLFLKLKEQVINIQSNIRFFLSMKSYIRQKYCRGLTMEIFEKSWFKLQNIKAVSIQKYWRGSTIRKGYKIVIKKMRDRLRLAQYKQHFMQVIFKIKYKKFIKRLNRYRKPIIMLQAIVRGKFARKSYQLARNSAILIQNAYRKHLSKKYFLTKLWKDYRKNLFDEEKIKAKEIERLGVNSLKVRGVKYYSETVSALVQLYPQELQYHYGRSQPVKQLWQINEMITFNDKNTFQCYIGDYDILGNQCYQGKWLVRYAEVKEEMKRRNQYPVNLALGEETTSVLSNKDCLYTFSAKGKVQVKRIDVGSTAQLVDGGDRSGYLLTQEGKVYTWGSNYHRYLDKTNNQYIQFREVPELSRLQILSFYCKGSKRYFIDGQRRTFYYREPQTHYQEWKLTLLTFGFKNAIKTVSASYNFVLFLNNQGQIYAQGHNNKGQLGLGFTSKKQVQQPELIPFFSKQTKQIIETISVGMGHAVAKSKLGYVYTWGDNCYRQATFQNVQFIHTPEPIESNEEGKIKVYQAVAGARATFLLTENLQTVGIGTSLSFPSQKGIFNVSLQLLKSTSNCNTLVEIKLSTRWIRELSILVITAIDSNRCKPGIKQDIIFKYSKMMAKQWTQDKVYPEYREWADSILQLSDIKRFKFNVGLPNGKSGKNKKSESQNNLEELRALMDLRKTSAIFKKAALEKIEEIMKRLASIPEDLWSQSDLEQHKYIKQNAKYLK